MALNNAHFSWSTQGKEPPIELSTSYSNSVVRWPAVSTEPRENIGERGSSINNTVSEHNDGDSSINKPVTEHNNAADWSLVAKRNEEACSFVEGC